MATTKLSVALAPELEELLELELELLALDELELLEELLELGVWVSPGPPQALNKLAMAIVAAALKELRLLINMRSP